jgi:predicted extracellular nuclease
MSGSKKTFLYILVIVLLALFIGGGNPLQAAAPGEVIVNEIMQNPAAVGDSAGEWFELYNTTGADIDINSWTIADNDIDSHTIDNGGPLLIPAGGYLVLGNNTDSGTNGGVPVAYSYGSNWFLSNGADEVILFDASMVEIDRVEYDGGPNFPDPTGASMALIDPALDNNVGANWCTSVTPLPGGDLGTPGAANDCPPPPLPDIVINEIMNDPSVVSDSVGEWFELYNAGSSTVDIEGWTIRDNDLDEHLVQNGSPLEIPAGGYLVLGINDDIGINGGTPVDYSYGSTGSFFLSNGVDEVVLLDDSLNEIDRVEYDGGVTFPNPTGATMSLIDPALDNNVGENWCTASTVWPGGAGDFGTPGVANDCAPPSGLQIVINEIMQNPSAVSDTNGEWFEIINTGDSPVDIDGWTIQDNDFDSHVISNGGPLEVPAGGFLVLGRNADFATNGGVTVDYEYADFFLANGADEVVLIDTNLVEVDRVEYDGGPVWPDPNGASMSLTDPELDNNNGLNWCEAITPFGDGDLGTPGSANICPPPEIIINEIIQNPSAVSDSNGEWFELYNAGDRDVNINGWTIRDDGFDNHLINNGSPLLLPAGGYLVLGRNADSGANGGVMVDYQYSNFFLSNSADEVVLEDNNLTEIDRVEYDGGPSFPDPNGASMSLDNPALDNNVGENWCTSVTPFGAGDLGTPGSRNICYVLTIMEIQDKAHTSPYDNSSVQTEGIVTVVRNISFYLQDPAGDGDPDTSDAILVFTGSNPGVAVGDAVTVVGYVSEFLPGNDPENLTTTEITDPTITINSSGNAVPAPTIIGNGGRVPPNMVIDDDGLTIFDPANDGIDFYESLEAMHVQVNDAQVVGSNFFGEIMVVGDLGANATVVSPRGGNVIRSDDFNPERILIDDAIVFNEPDVTVGDVFSAPVLGVMDYSFGNFKLLNYDPLPALILGNLPREQTSLVGTGTNLTMATFNVFNLDPGDSAATFADLAGQIVQGMNSPAIIGLQEIQDNSGPTDDGTVDADQTYTALITAIQAAGGPLYEFRDISPLNNTDGGQPGGNIRVGFLFRPDRVTYVDRPGGDAVTSTSAVLGLYGVELTYSPGRIDPTNGAFFDSRKPLAGEFMFGGEKVIVVVNHFNSKGGDEPLFGSNQPPTFFSEVQRLQQAQVVNDFVDSILTLDPNANVAVMGDLNDFQFSSPIQTLKDTVLTNLIDTLPANEQYTYIFDGNSQVLDHILVSQGLLNRLAGFDIVHANAEYEPDNRFTDHDPAVAQFDFPLITNADGCYLIALEGSPYTGPATIVAIGDPGYVPDNFQASRWGRAYGLARDDCYEIHGTDLDDTIFGDFGNDVFFGYGGDDVLGGKQGDDVFSGGSGADEFMGNKGIDEVLDFEPGIDYCDNIEIGCYQRSS